MTTRAGAGHVASKRGSSVSTLRRPTCANMRGPSTSYVETWLPPCRSPVQYGMNT
jgi:hypothetical protein